MINWKNIKYFERKDFACKCYRHNELNPALPLYAELNYYYICRYFLDPLRKDCGSAIIINSGGRCIPHNKESNGGRLSHHLIDGKEEGIRPTAIDIYCPKLTAEEFDLKIKKHTDINYCGYHIYKSSKGYFIHIDFRGYKSRW
jgi:hypothetical protein